MRKLSDVDWWEFQVIFTIAMTLSVMVMFVFTLITGIFRDPFILFSLCLATIGVSINGLLVLEQDW